MKTFFHTLIVSICFVISVNAQWYMQNPTLSDLMSVYFVDSDRGWAVGGGGTILNTSDGGETWVQQSSGTTSQLQSIYFTDSIKAGLWGGIMERL